jgi:hypothetical protein
MPMFAAVATVAGELLFRRLTHTVIFSWQLREQLVVPMMNSSHARINRKEYKS